MTALYFDVLRPQDRVAVKPHASPVFHAIQYLLGPAEPRQARALPRARRRAVLSRRAPRTATTSISRPARSASASAMTLFAALVQDYVRLQGLVPDGSQPGRMVALVGDAELDEGNIFEALLEGWKHDVRNVWWVIDYNRQSLDAVVSDRLFGRIDGDVRDDGLARRHAQIRPAAARPPSRGPDGEALRAGSTTARTRSIRRWPSRAARPGASICERDLGRDARHPRACSTTHDDAALRAADDQPRRPRHGGGARGLPRASPTTSRPASSPTRSRASACPSPATRTTTPG